MSQCLQEIKIKGLETGTNYIFEIWDKFDSLEVILDTAISNECALDLSVLTPNLLNCNAGEFILKIYETSDYETAKNLLKEAKSKGYNSAFLVAFNNGTKISIQEALKL
jgi:hypothetical protein